jgi:ATP-dependent helicase HepA
MSDWLSKLVLVHTESRFFGKVVAESSDSVDVEFFLSVADREVLQFPKREVSHLYLPAQTRVFVETPPYGWRVGRVVDRYESGPGTYSYTLKFPNDVVAELPEVDCFVRCLDRYADPSRILAAHCIETQFFADRRRQALRTLRRLRSAAQGLTGIISAAIELLPHQLATVRRVATDRHQRYLLADEVGLGKTIEAGLIIRQLLLDRPTLRVQVWVPAVLVNQWQDELESKCLLSKERVGVRAHEDLNDFDCADAPDLLVVDEAHRLIASHPAPQVAEAFRQIQLMASRAPRLLLLSAIPPLGEEAQLLALLNLLDPVSYPLANLEEFRRRVEDRQLIGRLLLAMRPGAAPFLLRQQATRAREMFPRDTVVQEEASRVLESGDDQRERDAATAALRDHIANTYRIHQRMIRARRVDVERWTMRPRGPEWPVMTHVRLFFSEDAYANALLTALEGWRDAANRASTDKDELSLVLSKRWGCLVQAAWQGGGVLATTARSLQPLFDGEAEDLSELERVGVVRAPNEDRYAVAATMISGWLRDLAPDISGQPRKLVCFASHAEDAKHLAAHLKAALGEGRVSSLVGLQNETASVVAEFAASAFARILVCDQLSEEGLNLQFVYGIVHLDLPFDAARIEQRIGRLDRFGRRMDRVEHRIFMPGDTDDSPWRNWFAVLANGFRVFNRSISDVQFQVQNLEREIGLRLFREGGYDIDGAVEDLAARLLEERQRLDEQHALDGFAQLIDAGDDIRRAIEASEDDEAALQNDVEPWLRDVLGLRVEPIGPSSAHTQQIQWPRETLLPEIPWRREFEPALHERWTWWRRQSMRKSVPRSHLLRPGSDLVEVLERVALWDDRGIAYATWRVDPRWVGQWRGFRLVWLVEPAVEAHAPIYVRRQGSEIRRRAEALLPTFTVEQYVDERGEPIEDPALLEVLARPYHQHRNSKGQVDLNLGSRPDDLREAIDWGQFVALIEEVTTRGRAALPKVADVAARLAEARRVCELDLRKARRSLEVRHALAEAQPGMAERPLPEEADDLETLRRAIEYPSIRLDEIGFFVISPTPPDL